MKATFLILRKKLCIKMNIYCNEENLEELNNEWQVLLENLEQEDIAQII